MRLRRTSARLNLPWVYIGIILKSLRVTVMCLPSLQSLRRLHRGMTSFSSLVQLLFGLAILSGFDSATIERLEIPLAVRNGSGPIDLVCAYSVHEAENGLVVKWYHNGEQIYMWIPPMEPRDLGVIAGFTSYTSEIVKRPKSHSIIRLKNVTLDMSGEYICSISTFVNEDVSRAKMTVYVRENMLDLQTSYFNETHVNVSCSAIGAHPLPVLKIFVESKILKNPSIHEDYPADARISLGSIIEKPTKATLTECEIRIPGTGYEYRKIQTYWPDLGGQQVSINAVRLISSAASSYQTDFLFGSILVFRYSIWICRSI